MSTAQSANFSFSQYIKGAQDAVLAEPTQTSIWAIAQYLDLVDAKEVPANAALVRECKSVVQRFVMANLQNDSFIQMWERAGCLFRAYKRALKAAERAINEEAALVA